MKNDAVFVSLAHYPVSENHPAGSALVVWVVDRFNEGEFHDFDKDELLGSIENYAAYCTAEQAMKDVNQDIRNELEELKKDSPKDFRSLRNEDKAWLKKGHDPKWELVDTPKADLPSYVLKDVHDGSDYTVRAIPLYLKGVLNTQN